MNKAKVKRIAFPVRSRLPLMFSAAAFAIAWLALPCAGNAQGIVRGAREGSYQGGYEGNRIAGPVGGVVGSAVGAGVGGAVGAVDGALGIRPYGWHHHCRGYYREGHFHCYR